MRVLLAGDTHGNFAHLKYLIREAKKARCEAIVQVGDFGFTWPGKKIFDAQVQPYLAKHEIDLYWLDGNHDNYTDLRERGIWDRREPQEMSPNVTYLPRGARWEWDGVTFMSLGGGVSIDKDRRIPGLSWWEEETITPAEAAQAAKGGQVDVMLTHDCPAGVTMLEGYLEDQSKYYGLPYKTEEASTKHREALAGVTNVVKPRLLVHGHYHYRYRGVAPWNHEDYILGLGRDTTGLLSWAVLDTEGWDGTGRSLLPEAT